MYSRCAFCTLVMLDNRYALGATALAKSLLATKSACSNFICLVTPDINQDARNALSVYWKLIDVDFLTVKKHPLKTKRMDLLYGSWIDYSCTKWQFLNILDTSEGYEQIMYIDADSCVLKNIDHLFFSQHGSAIQSTAYQAKICLFSCFQMINAYISKNTLTRIINEKEKHYYRCGLTNLQIPIEQLHVIWDKAIKGECRNQFLLSGAVMVWKRTGQNFPPIPISTRIMANIKNPQNVIFSGRKSLFYNGWDEQILMQSILDVGKNIVLEHLPLCYCWPSGFYYALPPNIQPSVMTFWGLKKPWYFDENTPVAYMDIYIWRYFYQLTVSGELPLVYLNKKVSDSR